MNSEIQNSFKALADPTRRSILIHLSKRDMTIGEVTDKFEMTRAAVKKHLKVLEKGKLISVTNNGRECINSLETEGLKEVTCWLNYFDQFWDSKLNNLRHVIERKENQTNSQEG